MVSPPGDAYLARVRGLSDASGSGRAVFRMAQRGRYLLLLGLLLAAAFMLTSDALHARVEDVMRAGERLIRRHSQWGMVVFVLLSMASAMLAFVSSALVVPFAVQTWGPGLSFVLLWLGWWLGGATAYAIGRFLGRRIAVLLVGSTRLAQFESRVSPHATFTHVLLIQAALPSEIPGYLLGLVRYPFGRYLAALALAELPYALGTIVLGESFLRRQPLLFLALGLAGIVLSAVSYALYHRRAHANAPDGPSSAGR